MKDFRKELTRYLSNQNWDIIVNNLNLKRCIIQRVKENNIDLEVICEKRNIDYAIFKNNYLLSPEPCRGDILHPLHVILIANDVGISVRIQVAIEDLPENLPSTIKKKDEKPKRKIQVSNKELIKSGIFPSEFE